MKNRILIIGFIIFVFLFVFLNWLSFAKTKKYDVSKLIKTTSFVYEIEDITKTDKTLTIKGYAYNDELKIEQFESYFLIKDEIDNYYLLNTKMDYKENLTQPKSGIYGKLNINRLKGKYRLYIKVDKYLIQTDYYIEL